MRFIHKKENNSDSGWWVEAWIIDEPWGELKGTSYISEEDFKKRFPGKSCRHVCENKVGGHHDYIESEIDGEKFANSWDSFFRGNYSSGRELSPLIKKDSKYGWISPTGEFFGCTVADHRLVAEKVFDKTEVELENSGYIKVSRCDYDLKDGCYYVKRPTEAQRTTLHRLDWTDEQIDDYTKE